MKSKVDLLVVGAGLTGATIAQMAHEDGKSVLVLERDKIAGMCRTEEKYGIMMHQYGPHVFHTNYKSVWEYVNRFAKFNGYVHRVKAYNDHRLYSFPINLETLSQIKGRSLSPGEMRGVSFDVDNADNLESYLVKKIGRELYEKFYEGYTEKMWGVPATDIPADIAKRIPIRISYNDLYFTDTYQGVPVDGYTKMIESMLEGVGVVYGDFLDDVEGYEAMAKKVVYTGPIDEYYGYIYGELPYRSMRYETKLLGVPDYQGVGQINFCDGSRYTRVIEHKHFNWVDCDYTLVTHEYPVQYFHDDDHPRFYPMPWQGRDTFKRYWSIKNPNTIFVGRLGTYQYLNMDQCILQATQAYHEAYISIK